MLNEAFRWLGWLRGRPGDRALEEGFLRAIRPFVARLARRASDPDEVVSDTLRRAWWYVRTCRAANPSQLGAWLKVIVRRPRTPPWSYDPLDDQIDRPHRDAEPPPGPAERAADRARGRAYELAVAAAVGIDPAALPPRERLRIRLRGVAATADGIRRDVLVMHRIRREAEPVVDVARELGISPDAAKKAAQRGAAALGAGAERALASAPDLLVRGALEELAELARA